MEDTYQSSLSKSSEARDLISEFIDYLPADLRKCYEHYNIQFVEIMKNIMEDKVGREDVMKYSKNIVALASECTNLIDSLIRECLD